MFSALRRLTGRGDAPEAGNPPPGLQTMSANLQRKFARGVQYNMKIVIKGDRNVGKTCLFHRLQGKKFTETYIPTEEIQVASIHWNYKATDDIVKVEVWDVVDKGKKKKTFDGLKLDNSQLEIPEEAALDAEFLDVYKGANGVILVLDITKSWTFNYIQKELPKIPEHIPIMILANHCDMTHHRTVTPHHLSFYVENLQRGPDSAQVRCCESSMRNGFGLNVLHKFFNLPFLQLQRDTLLRQLETNKNETNLTINELDLYMESEDANYNKFLEKLFHKRRLIADAAKPIHLSTSQSVSQMPSLAPNSMAATFSESEVKRSVSFVEPYRIGPIGGGHPISSGPQKTAIGVGYPHSKALGPNFNLSDVISRTSRDGGLEQGIDNNVRMQAAAPVLVKDGGLMSKLFGKGKDTPDEVHDTKIRGKVDNCIKNVDDFVPDDGGIDRSFLEDTGQETGLSNVEPESDSDSEFGNPLVSEFQDDLDPEDQIINLTSCKSGNTSLNYNNNNNNSNNNNHNNSNNNNNNSNNNNNNYNNNNSNDNNNSNHNDLNEISVKLDLLTTMTQTNAFKSWNGEGFKQSEESNVDNHLNNVQTYDITGEAIDNWLSCDSKWRRSPEGGEDTYSDCAKGKEDTASLDSLTMNNSVLEVADVKKEKKKKKEKEFGNKSKKTKKKSTGKSKEKSKEKGIGEKKKKNKSEKEVRQRDELEEFLNGPSTAAVDTSYEAF